MHDRVEDLQRQQRLLGLCRAWKERSAREVICAALRSLGLLAWLSVHGDADDRLRSEDCPSDPGGRIVASNVNSIGVQAAGEFRIVVYEKRDAKPVREIPQTLARGDLLLRRVGSFVAELNDRDAALEGCSDCRQQASDGLLR